MPSRLRPLTVAFVGCAAAIVLPPRLAHSAGVGPAASSSPPQAGAAQSASSFLTLSRGPGTEACVDAEEVAQGARKRLSADRDPATSGVTFEVEIAHLQPRGYRAVLVAREGAIQFGGRTIVSKESSCDELGRALVIAIAIVLDVRASPLGAESSDERQAGGPAPNPAPSQQPPELAPPPSSPTALPPQRSGEGSSRVAIQAGASLAAGILPDPRVGPHVALLVRPLSWLGIAGSLTYLGTNSEAVGPLGTVSRFGATVARLSGCAPLVRGTDQEAEVCAGIGVGRLAFETSGFARPTSGGGWLGAASFGGTVRQHIVGAFAASATARFEIPLWRDMFDYATSRGELQPLFRLPPVTGALDLGVEYWIR